MNKKDIDENLVVKLFIDERKSTRYIANELSIAQTTVRNVLKRQGIDGKRTRVPIGNKSKNGYGYVVVYMPNHPNSDKRGNILEHRLVMSNHLGRPLKSHEHVHHKNEIKSDNRIENLELTQSIKEHLEKHRHYSDGQLLSLIVDFYNKNGREPYMKDFRNCNGLPSSTIYFKRFGSILGAKELALKEVYENE